MVDTESSISLNSIATSLTVTEPFCHVISGSKALILKAFKSQNQF